MLIIHTARNIKINLPNIFAQEQERSEGLQMEVFVPTDNYESLQKSNRVI